MEQELKQETTARFTQRISFKIFFSFLFIIAVVAAITAATIYSLNNFQSLQNQFSKETISYLRDVQNFSKSASNYLVLVERLSSTERLETDLEERLLQERKRTEQLLDIVRTARQTSEKNEISDILRDINIEVDRLIDIKKFQLPILSNEIDESFRLLQNAITKVQQTVRRAEVQGSLRGGLSPDQSKAFDDILENTPNLQIALSFVYPIAFQTEVQKVQGNFVSATRSIINSNIRIKNVDTRSEISKHTAKLLEAINPNTGFFSKSEKMKLLQLQLNQIIQDNYKLENQLNDIAASLVSDANEQTQTELNRISDLTQSDVRNAFVSLIVALIAAMLIIVFFVNPQIVNRLQKLASDTSKIANGDLTNPIISTGQDEISDMGKALENFREKLIEKEFVEVQIREREALLSNIFSNAADGLMTLDQQGKILSFNHACEQIFQIRSGKIIGRNVNSIISDIDISKPSLHRQDGQQTSNENTIERSNEFLGVREDGSTFPLELSFSDVNLDESTTILCILRDVSERKRQQVEREELVNSLSTSNTQLAQFAYVCSHDLQEPMRMISAFSSKLEQRIEQLDPNLVNDEKLSVYLSQLTKGASNGQALIRGILQYSKIDHERTAFEAVDCNEIIADIRRVLETDEKAQIVAEQKLPNVRGMRTQIYQLFSNLISNGLKYVSPDVKPIVEIKFKDAGEHWMFEFIDNGIGIDAKNQKSIFEIFRRLHRRDEYPGTGIGLSICKKIIETHSGSITVSSELGKGSTFQITLLKE